MNQVFDFNRWLLLTGKHWSENRKKYILSLVAMGGLLLIWFSFVLLMERNQPFPEVMQLFTYFTGLFITGCLYGSLIFSDLASGPKAIDYLSIPASVLEKLLCTLFYGVFLFFICYTLIFYLVDFSMIKLANNLSNEYWLKRAPGYTPPGQNVLNVFSGEGSGIPGGPHGMLYFFLIYIAVQSAYILGSVYFVGYSFIKTSISLFLVFLFMIFLMGKVFASLMPHGYYLESITTYRLVENDESIGVVQLPGWINDVLIFLFQYALAPVFWVVTYFRLKEKEI